MASIASSVRNLQRALLAALLLPLLAAPAQAWDENLAVGLRFERSHLDLDSGAQARSSRLVLYLAEDASPWLRLYFHGGPVLLSLGGNPDTAGMSFTGYHLGVGAQAEWFRQQPLGLAAALRYGYQQVDDQLEEREATLSWHEGIGELAALVRMDTMQFHLGGYALYVDGDETISGDLHRSNTFKADRSFGAFAQADLFIDWSGRISLRADSGPRQSISLIFARDF